MKNVLFAFCLFFSALYAEEKLTVGTTSGYAPYVSLDAQGNYEGFDIDVARLIAEKLNRKLVIKDGGSMPGLMLSLKQKKIDVLIWAVSITEERLKTLDMVYYQGEKVQTMPFLFWKEAPTMTSIDQFTQTVCVEAGTYQEEVLKKHPSVKLKYVDKITDGIMELRYGKVFATAVDNSLVTRFLEKYPDLKVVYLPLASNEQTLGMGICINKTDPQLSAQVKKAIEELTAEGKIGELEKKWKLK